MHVKSRDPAVIEVVRFAVERDCRTQQVAVAIGILKDFAVSRRLKLTDALCSLLLLNNFIGAYNCSICTVGSRVHCIKFDYGMDCIESASLLQYSCRILLVACNVSTALPVDAL